MLPLALAVALLMALSSLSFQALALQQRRQLALLLHQRQREDQALSAAQRLAGRLQRQHRCLLALADHHWPTAPCSDLASLEALSPEGASLLAYQPGDGRGELLLQPAGAGPAVAFALHWHQQEGGEPQLQRVQELGLRGLEG
jgi:hypothetical protein